jgi:AraC-like DNA-binding protein
MDLRELSRNIDSRITQNPNLTSRRLAQELGVTAQLIEQAVREVDGVSFREYRENRRLALALRMLEEKRKESAAGYYRFQRAESRVTLPGATVAYLLRGRGIRKFDFSDFHPLIDLSGIGMAFLSDRPSKPGRTASFLIKYDDTKDALRLEGNIVYAVATDTTGSQYRIGVRFLPFDAQKGCNLPESLAILKQLKQAASRQSAAMDKQESS